MGKRLKLRRTVKAGFNDAALAPELVLTEPRISSPSENFQRISPDEAKLLQEIAGNPNVVSLDPNGEHFINPVHLQPEFEAIINRQRMNRDIPNNGPFTAENNSKLTKYASDLKSENEMLVKLCKTLIQQKQQLINERVELINEREQAKSEKIYAARFEKVSKVAQLMQRKGLIDSSEKSYAQKCNELLSVDDNSLLSIINLVRQVPEPNVPMQSKYAQKQPQVEYPDEPPIFIPDNTNNALPLKDQLQSKFESFPWGTSVSHR